MENVSRYRDFPPPQIVESQVGIYIVAVFAKISPRLVSFSNRFQPDMQEKKKMIAGPIRSDVLTIDNQLAVEVAKPAGSHSACAPPRAS